MLSTFCLLLVSFVVCLRCSPAVSFGHLEEHRQSRTAFIRFYILHAEGNTCSASRLQWNPCSQLYSQKPSDLAHSKESDQPEALSGISQTWCFSTIHSLLPLQPNFELEDHSLSADPNCFTVNVFIHNLKDSPRRVDAEHNQHGTYRWRHRNENYIHAEGIKLGDRQIIGTLMLPSIQRLLSFPEHCYCRRMCRCTEALCVLKLPCWGKVSQNTRCASVGKGRWWHPVRTGCLQFRKHRRSTPSIYVLQVNTRQHIFDKRNQTQLHISTETWDIVLVSVRLPTHTKSFRPVAGLNACLLSLV
jgi:hypothetical protein